MPESARRATVPRRACKLAIAAVPLTILLLAGCGSTDSSSPNGGTPQSTDPDALVPIQTGPPAAPHGFRQFQFRDLRVRLRAPRNWTAAQVDPPMVTAITSGPAVIAVWRFFRPGPAPVDRPQLAAARGELVHAVKARDPALELLSTRLTHIGGAGAVELDAIEQIGGNLRRIRTEHIYARPFEFVIEEYAPPAIFGKLDRAVFSPVLASLRLLDRKRP